ncbi:MAG: hypothetical protein IT383_13975 [Deltaproteobacteria bacterium]|nr:hypothetical protein [Deltaproteobacteria bacterium]
MATIDITGTLDERGTRRLIEIEVRAGSGRLRFARAPGPSSDTTLTALVLDELPLALVLAGASDGALVLATSAARLPAVSARPPRLDDEGVEALAPLLAELSDGLYTLAIDREPPVPVRRAGWLAAPPRLVDARVAHEAGTPVVASLGKTWVALAGAAGLEHQAPAWVLRADVIVEAPGFAARAHDRGAREAFARSPQGVLDDRVVRDAVAAHRALARDEDLGPFSEDRIEPAAQQARALAWDLRAEDGIENVAEPERVSTDRATEFRASALVHGVPLEVGFVSFDGRHIDEAVVRSGGRFRATGLRPAARALARTLRQLAEEGR